MTPNWSEVGRRLRVARELKGLSGREAARLAQISEGYLRHLERGGHEVQGVWQLPTHSVPVIVRVARVVGEDPQELLGLLGREMPEHLVDIDFSPVQDVPEWLPGLAAQLTMVEAKLDQLLEAQRRGEDPE